MSSRLRAVKLGALALSSGAVILSVPAVAWAVDRTAAETADHTAAASSGTADRTNTASAADEMPSLVEDFSYPGAEQIKQEQGIDLFKGDGRIMLAACNGNPDLIKVETLTRDVCFAVQGDTGWLSLRLDAVFLVGSGDQDVAVTVEGMEDPIEVPENRTLPIMAEDPSGKGVVLELRASASS